MQTNEICSIADTALITAQNAGLFVSPGHGIHPDRVIDSFELIFVRSGSLEMAEEERPLAAQTGQTLLLWPGRRHRGLKPYRSNDSFYWIHFRIGRTRPRETKAALAIPQRGTPARADRLSELFHHFLDDQEAGRLPPVAADALMVLMLCEAAEQCSEGTTPRSAESLAGRAAAYIAAHAHERIGARSIARHLRLNPDYLNRVFRKVYGATLTEFVQQRRIKEARSLLREGRLTVNEVAVACGFSDVRYFRRLFRRSEGISPAQFRRLYARVHVNVR